MGGPAHCTGARCSKAGFRACIGGCGTGGWLMESRAGSNHQVRVKNGSARQGAARPTQRACLGALRRAPRRTALLRQAPLQPLHLRLALPLALRRRGGVRAVGVVRVQQLMGQRAVGLAQELLRVGRRVGGWVGSRGGRRSRREVTSWPGAGRVAAQLSTAASGGPADAAAICPPSPATRPPAAPSRPAHPVQRLHRRVLVALAQRGALVDRVD